MPFMDNVRTGIRGILSIFQRILTWIWNVIGFIAGGAKENKFRVLVAFAICILMYIIYVLLEEYTRIAAESLAMELRLFAVKVQMALLELKLQQLIRTDLVANETLELE